MNSCEVHPLSQTNDLRQLPKRMIIYKHLLAYNDSVKNNCECFYEFCKAINLSRIQTSLFLKCHSSETPPTTLVYNMMSKSLNIGPYSLEGQSFRLMGCKDRGEQWTSIRMNLLGNWNESKFNDNQICERSFLVLWAIWTGIRAVIF